MSDDKIPLVGILGGVASGKSLVSEQLRQLGAAVISADKLAHEVLRRDEVKRQVLGLFGSAVFGPDGEVDRQQVAKIVFAPPPDGPRELKRLEQITHPAIGTMIREDIERLRNEGKFPAIVLDIPLLAEAGWNKVCSRVLYVDAPHEVRLARATGRGWSRDEFDRREAVQQSLTFKRELADTIIDNSGTAEATAAQVQHFWQSLTRSKPNAQAS
jgi:dephospho-CoA kinase